MTTNDFFMIVPSPFLSGLIWFILVLLVLYFARTPAHKAILAFCRVLQNTFRLTAHSVHTAEQRLLQRNKEVLLAQGREAAERIIEREFERIDNTVRKDLAEYPSLQRHLSEEITHIDADYKQSTEVPPEPPGWVKAVDAVAKIQAKDPMVANILEDIHHSMIKANTQATEEYRKASHQRHQHLKDMMPHWRKVTQILGQVDKSVTSLLTRSQTIDRHMEEYEGIVKATDRSVRMLSSSSMTQFFISIFVLAIAVGGALINFNLIARPLAEMVGGTNRIMGVPINNIAAMVIILVELAMGLFLMEAMRITRLFPVIGALNDKVRIRLAWSFFSILLFLALVEAGLAFMRELIMEDAAATRAILRGDGNTEVVETSYLWITTAAQMGMGFVLPFALMFVAIPLETFVHSFRTVVGVVTVGVLRVLIWLLHLSSNFMRHIASALVHLYDLLIFAPLWIEAILKRRISPGVVDNQDRGTSTASL
ncbi:MAG: hypothetical protein R6X06_05045 [Gammaproteobacteria bacterium]